MENQTRVTCDSFGEELKIGDVVIVALTDSYHFVTRFKGYMIGKITNFEKGFLEICDIVNVDRKPILKRSYNVVKYLENLASKYEIINKEEK